MADYQIIALNENYLKSYRNGLDVVARERKYLALEQAPSIEDVQAFFLARKKKNYPHYIALMNDEVIGWSNIDVRQRPVYQYTGVLAVGVLPAYRGKGIGEALMRVVIEKGKEAGFKRLELSVREANLPAIALYHKLGLVTEGVHKNAFYQDGKFENLLTMALLVP